jgi:hypothetical protein
LLFGHLKYNLFALSFWIFLFLIITDKIGFSYGIPFLFYSPEYNGEIGWISFALMGFAIGGFTMAFNTYSYMKLGTKYPFLATLSRPFIRFCFNNAVIPVIYNCYFIYRFINFQRLEEFASESDVYAYIFSYLGGFTLFISIVFETSDLIPLSDITINFTTYFPAVRNLCVAFLDVDEELSPKSHFQSTICPKLKEDLSSKTKSELAHAFAV